MGTMKKLYFANGTDTTAPADLSFESSTNSLEPYVDDAAFVTANGSAVEGDIYLNTTLKAPRAYLGGAWRTGLMASDAANATKTVGFDLTGSTTGTSQTLDFDSTASRVYTFPDYAGRVVIQTGTETNPVLFPTATGNIDIGSATSTTRIVGNLEVQGTAVTINTQTLEVEDQNILINNGGTDVTAQGAGLTVERTGTSGSLIYDSATVSKWKAGNLGSEVELLDKSSAQVVTGKDIDGGTASNTSRITVPKAAKTTLDALTRKEGTILYGTDTKKHYTDDGTTLNEMGGGSGGAAGRNYLQNWYTGLNPIASVTGLTTTGNRTSSQTLWGASATGDFEAVNNVTAPLRESGDIKLDSKNTTINAFIESPLFAADLVDVSKPLVVSFDITGNTADGNYDVVVIRYNSGGTYQETISVAGNASTGTPASAKLPTGTTTFKGFFITSGTSTDLYAVRFRKLLAVNVDVQIDSLFVGPQSLSAGVAVTDWQSYTPTFTGFGTPSSVQFAWRRSGSDIEIVGSWVNGTTTAVEARVSLPFGITAAAAPILSSIQQIGYAIRNVANGPYYWPLLVESGVNYVTFAAYNASNAPLTKQTASSQFATGELMKINCKIPIAEWTSNVTTAERAVEEYASNSDQSSTVSVTGSGFENSINGQAFSSNWVVGSTWTRRCRFNGSGNATDTVFLEVSEDTGATWFEVGSYGGGNICSSFIQQGSNSYGIAVRSVSGSNTDFDVVFQPGGRFSSNATYAGNGSGFNTLSGGVSRWRLRRIKGGAAVGYPVSARNIVGDTSGTAVPSGYIGETIFAASAGVAVAASGADAIVSSISLNAGTYIVFGHAALTVSTLTGITQHVAYLQNNTLSQLAGNTDEAQFVFAGGVVNNPRYNCGPIYLQVPPGSTYVIQLRCSLTYSGGSGTWGTGSSVRAIRIT